MSDLFDSDELDQLGEMVNIAMGKAGATLAEAFSGFVSLNVPEIRTVEAADIQRSREQVLRKYTTISAVRQMFFGEFAGDVLVIYGPASYTVLRDILGFDERDEMQPGRKQREELLLELGNALASTCILEVARQLDLLTGLQPPRMLAIEASVDMVDQQLFGEQSDWACKTFQIDIVFHLKEHDLPFELLITVAPQSIGRLQAALAKIV